MTKYWFKPKKYGLGAYPSSWEGWFLTIGCILVIVYRSFAIKDSPEQMNRFFVELFFIVIILVYISWKKTDGTWEWRWGN